MYRLTLLTIMVLGLVCGNFYAVSLAQDEATPEETIAEETIALEYASGTVKSVSSSEVVVEEYISETDETAEVKYLLDPEVELVGANSLQDITAGKSVEITYVLEGEQKIAKSLKVLEQ